METRGSQKTILIVDDNKKALKDFARILRIHGFNVQCAVDGAQGVQMAESLRPDVVLLDVRLPSLDGFQVMEQIKARNVPTRVIMISGEEKSIPMIIRAIKGGAGDYLLKPILSEEVVGVINRVLLVEDTLKHDSLKIVPIRDRKPVQRNREVCDGKL
jgi:DNA-binding response OmpR family regulator